MVLMAWLPLVPVVAGWRDVPARNRSLAFGPLALGLGFLLGAPGAIAHPAQFFHGVQHLMTQYGGAHPPHSHLKGGPVADLLVDFFRATLGWPLLAAAALGGCRLARRRQWVELALMAGPVLIFAGYFAMQSVFLNATSVMCYRCC
jgi:cobalamin biosynthesis protein CobD/CbiB